MKLATTRTTLPMATTTFPSVDTMPSHYPRDRPPGFAALTWTNCPPQEAIVETHNFRSDGGNAIQETSGIALHKYLTIYGEEPGAEVWFRVVPCSPESST